MTHQQDILVRLWSKISEICSPSWSTVQYDLFRFVGTMLLLLMQWTWFNICICWCVRVVGCSESSWMQCCNCATLKKQGSYWFNAHPVILSLSLSLSLSLILCLCVCVSVHTFEHNNNNNNNNHDNIYSAVIYGASHMREFTVVPLGQSWSAPGGRQLVGQAANLTSPVSCYRLKIRPSPFVLVLNHKVDTHLPSLGGWKAEST